MVTGVITRLAEKRTDHDEPWAIMEITDETGAIDVLVFPLAHARTQWNGLASGARVQVFGNVSDRPDAVPEIAAKAVSSRLPEESEGRKDA
ncbi:OB-fold nucleic acid binding protein [Naumannella halotolerans]|uniref:OB-fold nucleic acid binding protein n=2 Tax=Naumannella halotolerans TaxID=993414 RepID=A0A4R7J165_9ACTN|nr:OB-fold nucleic acid binding protein [Naumannella halotolerans]